MRKLDGKDCEQVDPSDRTKLRASRYMDAWNASERDVPGFWVKLTARLYAYREHTGGITFWRSGGAKL